MKQSSATTSAQNNTKLNAKPKDSLLSLSTNSQFSLLQLRR